VRPRKGADEDVRDVQQPGVLDVGNVQEGKGREIRMVPDMLRTLGGQFVCSIRINAVFRQSIHVAGTSGGSVADRGDFVDFTCGVKSTETGGDGLFFLRRTY
jgi:hypothetical protein